MLERARQSDRHLALAIGTVYAIGIVASGLGVWAFFALDGDPPGGRLAGKGLVGGVLGGFLFIAIATAELFHRLRHGPQVPGRHAADDADR